MVMLVAALCQIPISSVADAGDGSEPYVNCPVQGSKIIQSMHTKNQEYFGYLGARGDHADSRYYINPAKTSPQLRNWIASTLHISSPVAAVTIVWVGGF
jgi:hypothetical protein